jgi:predicted PurR-regulated permease PerM
MSNVDAARAAALQRIKAQAKADQPEGRQPSPPWHELSTMRGLLTVLTVLAVGVIMWAARDILVPTAMAVVLALILTPIVSALEKLRIPTGIASTIVVLLAAAVIAAGVYAVMPSVIAWIERAPEIGRNIESKLTPLKGWITTYESASDELSKITEVGKDPNAPKAVVAEPGPSVMELAPAVLAQIFYVIVLALFLIGARKVYRKRLIMLATEREDRLRTAHILSDSLEQVSEYLFTMMCVSIGLAVVTSAAFAVAGIENPILWGIAFGIGSFIPYLGPTVVILACAVVQFASQATLAEAAVGPLILLAINTLEANLVTPLLVARRVGVSAVAIFVAIALLVWLWGAAASILAVPLLIIFNAIAKNIESLQPYAILLLEENSSTDEITKAGRRDATAENKEPPTWRERIASLLGQKPAGE